MAQFVAATFDQQKAQALKQGLVGLTETRQTEQACQRLAQIANRFVGSNECKSRTLDGLLAVQPPQPIAQRQGFDLLQHGGKTVTHTIGLAQQAGTAPDQFFEIVSRDAQADHLGVERQFLRCALQQFEQVFGRFGLTQGLAEVFLAQCASQQLQQAQVLVGFGSDTNRQVNHLSVAPVHPFGELHQTHTGGKHQVAGFRVYRVGWRCPDRGRSSLAAHGSSAR